jgi:hypothetical protein
MTPRAFPLDVRRRALTVLPFLSGVVAARGLGLGMATDYDSRAILEISIPAILDGGYAPSRSLGFPLYEGIAAVLYAAGGLTLVNAFSLVLTVGFGLLTVDILRRSRGPLAGLAAVAILFLPIVLINATIMMETALTLLLSAAMVHFAMKVVESEKPAPVVGLALVSALAILTRPDNVLAVAAVHLALLSMPRSHRAWVCASGIGAVAAAAGIYVFLRGGIATFAPTTATMMSDASLPRKAARAALMMAHAVTLPGSVAVLGLMAIWLRRLRPAAIRVAPLIVRIALVSVVLYVPRFVLLPDELEYLAIPVVFVLMAMALLPARPANVALYGLLALVIAASNVVQVSLLQRRAGGGDAYSIVPSLQPGALLQDWTARAHRPALLSEEFSAYVAREAFGSPPPEIHAPLFWHAFVSPDGADLVTDADNIYLFDNPRLAARPELSLSRYRRVAVCDETLFPDEKAWRALRPAPRFTALERFQAGGRLHCRRLR